MTLLERKLSLPDRPRKTTLSANDGRTLTSVMCHPWPLDRGKKASLAATSGLKDSVRSGWNAASSAIDWQLPGGVFCPILEQEHMRGYTFTWLLTYSRIQHLERIFNIIYANKLLGEPTNIQIFWARSYHGFPNRGTTGLPSSLTPYLCWKQLRAEEHANIGLISYEWTVSRLA